MDPERQPTNGLNSKISCGRELYFTFPRLAMDQIIEDIATIEVRYLSAKDVATYGDGAKGVNGEPP